MAVSIMRKGFPRKSLVEVRSVHAFSLCPACGRGHGLDERSAWAEEHRGRSRLSWCRSVQGVSD